MRFMKTDVFAFVDEFGDTNIAFEKKGATTYFIITWIMRTPVRLFVLTEGAQLIR